MIGFLLEDLLQPAVKQSCKKNKVDFSALWNALLTGWALFCWEDYYIVSDRVLHVDSKHSNSTSCRQNTTLNTNTPLFERAFQVPVLSQLQRQSVFRVDSCYVHFSNVSVVEYLNKWRWDKNANIPKNTHERVVWTDIATTNIKWTYKQVFALSLQIRTRETIKWDTKDRCYRKQRVNRQPKNGVSNSYVNRWVCYVLVWVHRSATIETKIQN